jgi:hypothetical protein
VAAAQECAKIARQSQNRSPDHWMFHLASASQAMSQTPPFQVLASHAQQANTAAPRGRSARRVRRASSTTRKACPPAKLAPSARSASSKARPVAAAKARRTGGALAALLTPSRCSRRNGRT